MKITDDIKYVGVNDHTIDLFEGIYNVPNGMAYNSYVIVDEKVAVIDTVEVGFTKEWLSNIENVLKDRKPDYLIIQHMEPDHSANIKNFVNKYTDVTLVASQKAFSMMKNFYGIDISENIIVVADGDMLFLGTHILIFAVAPMVHWPEVIVTYDSTDKVLFSADSFGKFGALDVDEEWLNEARRYYIGIVGKYGFYTGKLLTKLNAWEVNIICPLHGPVLKDNIEYYVELYTKWSNYEPEEEGVVIAYTSVYGNTRKAVFKLRDKLEEKGLKNIIVHDLARCDMSVAVADAFRYNRLVLATTTYNAQIFPPMREFINELIERNYANRMVALIENGSWAPIAAKIMKEKIEKSNNISFADNSVRILSALSEESIKQLDELTDELLKA